MILMGMTLALDFPETLAAPAEAPRRRPGLRAMLVSAGRAVASGVEWVFGVVSLLLGLSILAAMPLAQFLSLGYFLESSARVGRTGRLRDGFIGVRRAARVGGVVAGAWLAMVPAWVVASMARSAALIDPGGSVATVWRVATAAVAAGVILHIGLACARGGRLRHFAWPPGDILWLYRGL